MCNVKFCLSLNIPALVKSEAGSPVVSLDAALVAIVHLAHAHLFFLHVGKLKGLPKNCTAENSRLATQALRTGMADYLTYVSF